MSRWTIKVTREVYFTHLQDKFPNACDFTNHIEEKIRSYSVSRDRIPDELINWISLAKRDIAFYMESCINWIDTKNNAGNHDPSIEYKIDVYANGRHGNKTLRKTLIIQSRYNSTDTPKNDFKKYILIIIKMKDTISTDSIKYIRNNIFKKCPNIFNAYMRGIHYIIGEGFDESSYYYPYKDFKVINILELIKSIQNDILIEDKSEFKENIGYIPMSKLKLEMILGDVLKMTKEKNEGEKRK